MMDQLKLTAWKSFGLSVLLVAPVIVLPESAAANGAGAKQTHGFQAKRTPATASSGTQSRAQPRYQQGGRYRGSRAQEQIAAHRRAQAQRSQAGARLVSPLGGAANIRVETYQQLGSQIPSAEYYAGSHVHGSGCGHAYPYAQPYVVYLHDDVLEPPVYEDDGDAAYGVAAQPVQGPIYVVQPQPAPRIVHVPTPVPSAETAPPAPRVTTPVASPPVPETPRSTEPQAIRLRVHPADAQVYLDDEPLGTGEIASTALSSLAPGIYVLEVTHGNYPSQRLVFGVTAAPVSITIDLTADRPSRRARVK